jgi:hypothetical protein
MNPQPDDADIVGMVFVTAEFLGRYCTKAGQIENMVNIQDIGGMGLSSMPHSKMKSLL